MKSKSLLPLLIAIVGLFSLPLFISNPYYIHLIETILIYTILLYGLDIVVGYVGQVSLGHAALFGIGSYTAGVLFFHFGTPIWVTLPAAIVVTSIFGGILALPALKVIGPYLAMVTLAFGTITQILINEMTWLTEGPLGIKIPKPDLMGAPMSKAQFFWLVCIVLILSLIHI
jgi:ABC-type branched-subunit amino acid transport system permease subunit